MVEIINHNQHIRMDDNMKALIEEMDEFLTELGYTRLPEKDWVSDAGVSIQLT